MLDLTPEERSRLFEEAKIRRESIEFECVVITGSNGKTTVKEIIKSILCLNSELKFSVSEENQNTKIALANQILNLNTSTQIAVFEVGARKKDDFKIPFSYLQPKYRVLLNIGKAHQGVFSSEEILIQEKLSVLQASKGDYLIYFGDDIRIKTKALEQNYHFHNFGFGYRDFNSIQIIKEDMNQLHIRLFNKIEIFKVNCLSPMFALNAVAAIATCLALKIPLEQIKMGIENFKGFSRRFEIKTNSQFTLIDDAFNSSPESLQQGLIQLSKISSNKKVLCVLGSMLELGNISDQEHTTSAKLILKLFQVHIQDNLLSIILVGEETHCMLEVLKKQLPKTFHFKSVEEAKNVYKIDSLQHEIVYLKGSKSINLKYFV